MKENRMKNVLESIGQRDVPADTNLWTHIAERVERKKFMQTLRTRPALALVIVLLALALLSSVVYAIGKVTGFIPGVGIVDQSVPLRILTEPVVAEREGLTVTVSQVVADSNHTFVAYAIEGLFWSAEGRTMCGVLPALRLPDGTTLSAVSGGYGPRGGRAGDSMNFKTTVDYPAIPAGVDNVTFTFPCILLEGAGPENWQILLKLSPAPKDYATPAVETGATFAAPNPMFVTTPTTTSDMTFTPGPCNASFPNGSGLYLDKVIELPDSYILVGNFTDTGDLPGGLEVSDDPYDDLPEIKDAAGNTVAYKVRDDIQPEINDCYWARYWAYEIVKPVQGPLMITLDQINIVVSDTAQFNFDTGSNPQTGQKWELNLPIHLGTYDYVMDSVEVVEAGYLFKYHSGVDVPEGSSLLFNIIGTSPEQTAGTVNAQKTIVEYSESVTFSSSPPTGPLTVELTLYESVPLQGPWKLTWTPPSN